MAMCQKGMESNQHECCSLASHDASLPHWMPCRSSLATAFSIKKNLLPTLIVFLEQVPSHVIQILEFTRFDDCILEILERRGVGVTVRMSRDGWPINNSGMGKS
jgi:hypothetical protein